MDSERKATFLIIITGRKQGDNLLSALREANVNLVNVIYGKGAAKEGVLKNMFGLVTEENKAILSCVTTCAKADVVLKLLVEKFNFDKPNTGVAFTIPVEAVAY